jgi:4-amino-4-deoxy-L-arabinose transferase-like glycosyltransferase
MATTTVPGTESHPSDFPNPWDVGFPFTRSRRLPAWLVVAAVAGTTFFTNLGWAVLFDDDESKNAECAREMLVRGDWVVPTFNEDLRPDKPILLYWLMLSAYRAFGVTEFAARFSSAVCGVGTCLLTFHIGRLLFSLKVGTWAGVMLATCLMFTAAARASTPDSALIFFTTLSLYLFVRAGARASLWTGRKAEGGGRRAEDERRKGDNAIIPLSAFDFPLSWKTLVPIYAVMAVAVLTKGPVGVLLPCSVIGLFLFVDGVLSDGGDAEGGKRKAEGGLSTLAAELRRWCRPRRLLAVFLRMKPAAILLCLAVVALPWYVLVGIETDGAWLRGFFGNHNFGRFARPMEGHRGSVAYYPLAMLAGFFPWSVFLPWAVVAAARQIRGGNRRQRTQGFPESPGSRRGLLFLACWLGVFVVFFTLARTKLPNYVLPCYPALALVTAWLFDERPWVREGAAGGLVRAACIALSVVGLLFAGGIVFAANRYLPGLQALAAAGLIPLCGGLVALWLFQRNRMSAARISLAATAVCFILAVFAWMAPQISRQQNGRLIANELDRSGETPRIATFNYSAPGLVFYSRSRIHHCRTAREVATFLSEPGSYLVTRSDRVELLEPHLPPGTAVLHRHRRFLREHDVVIIGRVPSLHPRDFGKPLRSTGLERTGFR